MEEYESELSYIDLDTDDPLTLFKEWQKVAEDNGCPYSKIYGMCLATSSKNGKVRNRTVQLKELTNESFNFCTTAQGRKVQEMINNPNVAITFLWTYDKDCKIRQVRIEGKVKQLDMPITQKYYNEEPFFSKVRAYVCVQGEPTDWNTLKKAHDELVKDVTENRKELPMPLYYRAFKIIPDYFEFYNGSDTNIADRIIFTKEENKWEHTRVGT